MAIATAVQSTVIESNFESVDTMKSTVNSLGALKTMSMYVRTYAEPKVAVAREIIANARDASVMAGATRPIEVSTPNDVSANLVVRDFGVGMTSAEVEDNYLAFAASTKDQSNEFVGKLGIGSKAPWNLCESFLVDTVKDGKRTSVRASRDFNHQVYLRDVPTDQPDGTTVTIPVSPDGDWETIVRRVAAAHDPNTVTVDGSPIVSVKGGPNWIGPVRLGKFDVLGGENMWVLSGGTLFGVPHDIRRNVTARTGFYGMIIELPIGSFEHTPGRESIIADPSTTSAIDNALNEFDKEVAKLSRKITRIARTNIDKALALRNDIISDSGASGGFLPIDLYAETPKSILKTNGGGRWTAHPECGRRSLINWHANLTGSGALIITDVPEGSKLHGIGKYMANCHRYTNAVIPLTEGTDSLTIPLVSKGGEDANAEWKITAKSKGFKTVSYAQFRKELKAIPVVSRGKVSERPYNSTLITDGEGGFSTLRTLDEVIKISTDIPVIMVWEGEYVRPADGIEHGVILSMGTRKEGPVLAKIPSAMSLKDWRVSNADKLFTSMSVDTIRAAMMLEFTSSRSDLFEIAYLIRDRVSDHPLRDTLLDMAKVWEISLTLTKKQRLLFRGVSEWNMGSSYSEKYADMVADLRKLMDKVNEAYPLSSAYISYRRNSVDAKRHVGEYLLSVSPIGTDRREENVA